MAGVTCLDIEEEISDQGLLRADDLNSVQKLLESVNVKPKSRACFATFVATYGDVEVQSIQIEFRESEEYPKFLDKLNGIFSGAPEGAMYSFRRKMRSFVFKPNRLYSDWLPAQELDVKVIKSFSLNILNVPKTKFVSVLRVIRDQTEGKERGGRPRQVERLGNHGFPRPLFSSP